MRSYALALSMLASLAAAGSVSAACDPGANPLVPLADVKLVMTGFATDKIDDSFRFEAVLVPTTTIDPVVTGIALELSNEFAGVFAAADVPGGDGWRARARGAASFSDPEGAYGGITRIKLKPLADGTIAVAIAGRRQPYAISTGVRPIRVALGFGTATGAECGVAFLSYSRCEFQGSSNVLRCMPPPSQRRCGADPDVRVRCDAANAAAAQETYYVSHGRYVAGACSQLPAFVSSPETICVATGNDYAFALTTAGTAATVSCTYESAPDADDPNLVCS